LVKIFIKKLYAVQEHIVYYSALGKGNLSGLQQIVNQLIAIEDRWKRLFRGDGLNE